MKLRIYLTGKAMTVFLAVMAMTMLGSCSDEPTTLVPASPEGDDNLEEVRFTTRSLTNSRFTDNGFQENDLIYLHHAPGAEANFDMYGYAIYTYKGDKFLPTNSSYKIMKKKSEVYSYLAYTGYYSRQADRLVFEQGKDYLFTYEETADMDVELLFIHLPARLSLEVKDLPSNTKVSSVKLVDIYKTYNIEFEQPFYSGVDMSPSNLIDVEMTRIVTNHYEYYVPPVQYVRVREKFIEVKLSNGSIYYYGPPETMEFDSNTLYMWEVNISNSTPYNEKSRSEENMVNPVKIVKVDKINSAKVPFIKKMDTAAQP